jgi:hypothetical protein
MNNDNLIAFQPPEPSASFNDALSEREHVTFAMSRNA